MTAGDGPSAVGAALRGALAERADRDDHGAPAALGVVGAFDVDLGDPGAATTAPGEGDFAGPLDVEANQRDTWVPDSTLAMPFSTGPRKKLISDRGPLGRGSPPPLGHDQWTKDQALQASAGIEALQTVLDGVGPAYLTDEQIGWLGPMWRELVEGMERAGLHLDD